MAENRKTGGSTDEQLSYRGATDRYTLDHGKGGGNVLWDRRSGEGEARESEY